jgi:hypothetical protein
VYYVCEQESLMKQEESDQQIDQINDQEKISQLQISER